VGPNSFRMRAAAVALPFGAVAMTVTAMAIASPQFAATFEMTHSPSKPGSSAGIDTRMTWSDPGEPGGKPKRVTRIALIFNRGTKIDTSAVTPCRASNAAVLRQGVDACPRSSRIGSATSKLTTGSGPPAETQINFFNARKQIIVLVRTSGRTLAVYRDDIRGTRVTVNLALPSSLALLELHAQIKPHSRGHGKRRKIYFRNPSTCPQSGEWTTNVIFTYADGSTEQLRDGTPCRRT
jgi:hypothetical protein